MVNQQLELSGMFISTSSSHFESFALPHSLLSRSSGRECGSKLQEELGQIAIARVCSSSVRIEPIFLPNSYCAFVRYSRQGEQDLKFIREVGSVVCIEERSHRRLPPLNLFALSFEKWWKGELDVIETATGDLGRLLLCHTG